MLQFTYITSNNLFVKGHIKFKTEIFYTLKISK